MKNLLKLKQANFPENKGFITLEILIALLAAVGFVLFSLQGLVFAMGIKVKAQEKQRANQLIQEDVELLNQLGSNPALAGTCNANTYLNGYASALFAALPAGNQTKTIIRSIEDDGSLDEAGRQVALRRFHVSNTPGNSAAPHRTLRVAYQVWHWDGGNFVDSVGGALDANDLPIAETYVEIIPDVALQCP